jgi:hypothetical protein
LSRNAQVLGCRRNGLTRRQCGPGESERGGQTPHTVVADGLQPAFSVDIDLQLAVINGYALPPLPQIDVTGTVVPADHLIRHFEIRVVLCGQPEQLPVVVEKFTGTGDRLISGLRPVERPDESPDSAGCTSCRGIFNLRILHPLAQVLFCSLLVTALLRPKTTVVVLAGIEVTGDVL